MDEEYQYWLEYLFDRDESLGDWRFSLWEDYEPDELSIVLFTTRMFENFRTDVCPYSDWQIAMGVDYIFNNSCSNFVFAIRDSAVDIELRVKAIEAMKNLYIDCFDTRCDSVLGHLSEQGNSLNYLCYMLWDATALSYCEDMGANDANAIYRSIASVMECSIGLNNIACVEGGLHGLGHLSSYYPKAGSIIGRFRKNTTIRNKKLLNYAKQAESGCIQ